MKYQIIDNYFDTPIFGEIVQHYFDTVLAALFADHAMTETKGRFVVNGVEKKDYYDMPYPVHILNGLIPTLKIYEQHLKNKNLIDNPDTETLLKVFMLGFTLHDANKLVRVPEQKGKSDLELALEQLHADVGQFRVKDFLGNFDDWQNEIFFLALGTENRTQVLANQYPLQRNEKFLRETLRPLCHLADSLASIQELESPGMVHESITRKLGQTESVFGKFPVSYVEVRQNPYTLTSQNLLQAARKVLAKNGKKVCFALRNGFVFFGEDVTNEELKEIQKYSGSQVSDLDPVKLTKVKAEKCDFGFLGSVPLTVEILNNIEEELNQQFLALSPNSPGKIQGFSDFVEFLKKFLSAYAPADRYISPVVDEKTGSLYLRFAKVEDSEEGAVFRKLICLHKIQWLNGKRSKAWAEDFDNWVLIGKPEKAKKEKETHSLIPASLPSPFSFDDKEFVSLADVALFIEGVTNTATPILKTLFAIAKSWNVQFAGEVEAEEIIAQLQREILGRFSAPSNNSSLEAGFIENYFHCRGEEQRLLSNYKPVINPKSEMCLFSGAKADEDYKESTAFGVKARGFSNRTVTSLANTQLRISKLFAVENTFRISTFPESIKANLCLYTDYFETSLDVSRDIITAAAKARNLKFLEDRVIEIDKNAKFHYNLFNLDFVSLKPKVAETFYQVRRWLLMVKHLGLRAYVTGIMSPYVPHKEVFCFENAPTFLKAMGWHSVRLSEVEQTLLEMNLVISFGPKRVDTNLLQLANSRRAYFRLYYMLTQDERKKVQRALLEFVTLHHTKFFPEMTIIQQLVELALPIEKAAHDSSGAQETWLIRTATDYLRTYAKQERPREEIIAKISGEIYRKMRREYVADKLNSIENFATAVYDLLYVEAWKMQLPTANVQKDWIYEFAFVFKKRSREWFEENKKSKGEQPPQTDTSKSE